MMNGCRSLLSNMELKWSIRLCWRLLPVNDRVSPGVGQPELNILRVPLEKAIDGFGSVGRPLLFIVEFGQLGVSFHQGRIQIDRAEQLLLGLLMIPGLLQRKSQTDGARSALGFQFQYPPRQRNRPRRIAR